MQFSEENKFDPNSALPSPGKALPDQVNIHQQKIASPHFLSPNRFRKRVVLIFFCLLTITVAGFLLLQVRKEPADDKTIQRSSDGYVKAIANYIIKNETSDPRSFEPVHWTKVRESKDLLNLPTYQVAVVYKIKSAEGKTVMKSKIFEFNADGTVLLEFPTEPFKF